MNIKTKKSILIAISAFIVALMIFSSSVFDNKEIIFPEIAAIAAGMMIAPKMPWNTSKPKTFVYINLCAVCGVMIVKYLHIPVCFQMIAGYALAQIFLILSGTTFAPMISAMVLPIMLQTHTLIYIISTMFFTGLILIFRIVSEKAGLVEKHEYIKTQPNKKDFFNLILRTLLAAPIVVTAINFNWNFIVAPPLLVAFTEFSKANSPIRKKLGTASALVTIAALVGSVCRYISIVLNLPLFLFAAAAIVIVALVMYGIKMYLPPAGAVAVLAMLIPSDRLMIYPLEIFVGISLLAFVSKICFKSNINQTAEKSLQNLL